MGEEKARAKKQKESEKAEMRDRLIELIKEGEDRTPCAFDPECDCEGKKCGDCEREAIADHLLANGVIVPPVKIGQTVYIIDKGDGECAEDYVLGVEVTQIFINKHGIALDLQLPLGLRLNTWAVIGKNVFLTKEEAEKALERSGE